MKRGARFYPNYTSQDFKTLRISLSAHAIGLVKSMNNNIIIREKSHEKQTWQNIQQKISECIVFSVENNQKTIAFRDQFRLAYRSIAVFQGITKIDENNAQKLIALCTVIDFLIDAEKGLMASAKRPYVTFNNIRKKIMELFENNTLDYSLSLISEPLGKMLFTWMECLVFSILDTDMKISLKNFFNELLEVPKMLSRVKSLGIDDVISMNVQKLFLPNNFRKIRNAFFSESDISNKKILEEFSQLAEHVKQFLSLKNVE